MDAGLAAAAAAAAADLAVDVADAASSVENAAKPPARVPPARPKSAVTPPTRVNRFSMPRRADSTSARRAFLKCVLSSAES